MTYTRITEGTVSRNIEYTAYMMFEDESKEYLASSGDKNMLLRKSKMCADFFQLQIIDNTD